MVGTKGVDYDDDDIGQALPGARQGCNRLLLAPMPFGFDAYAQRQKQQDQHGQRFSAVEQYKSLAIGDPARNDDGYSEGKQKAAAVIKASRQICPIVNGCESQQE